MHKQSFFSAVSFLFMMSAAMAQTTSIAVKANIPDFIHGVGVSAETSLGKHFSMLTEYRKINYRDVKTEGLSLLFVSDIKTIDRQVNGSQFGLMFRVFPTSKAMGGWFVEGGGYLGRYDAKIVQTQEQYNLSWLFRPIGESSNFNDGDNFSSSKEVVVQRHKMASGTKVGFGWSKIRKSVNLELSGGYALNFNDLDERAGRFAKDGTLYLRCALGGVFSFKK